MPTMWKHEGYQRWVSLLLYGRVNNPWRTYIRDPSCSSQNTPRRLALGGFGPIPKPRPPNQRVRELYGVSDHHIQMLRVSKLSKTRHTHRAGIHTNKQG